MSPDRKRHEVHVGFACSYHCVFCPSAAPGVQRAWAKKEDIVAEIDRVRSGGAQALNFSGGEPSLHPDFLEIVRHAREAGFPEISLITNGYGFAENKRCRELLESGIGRVGLSLHSHKREIEDQVTQSNGAFDRKIRALGNLVRSGVRLSVKTVLHSKNIACLPELVSFLAGLGVTDVGFNSIRPGHLATGPGWIPAFGDLTPRIRELIIQNESGAGMQFSFLDLPVCKLPWEVLSNPGLRERYLGVNLEREITIFLPKRAGGKQHIDWRRERAAEMKTHPDACRRCMLKESCEGVWRGYLELYGDQEFESGPGVVESCLA